MATGGLAVSPLVVITGPTASGKTSLAIELAERYGGEIICADSRTIYRGMDVGTAKPSAEEQARVPHWGVDLVDPGEYFSVADFKDYAEGRVADIRSRGKVPFLVGGTGLYVDALIFDFTFGPRADPVLRERLKNMSLIELQNYCKQYNIDMPDDSANPRRLMRAIERSSISVKRREQPIDNCIVVGIATDKLDLRTRIEFRAEQIFSEGVVEESTELAAKYGWDSEAMTGNIYPLVKRHLNGEIDSSQLKQEFVVSDWRLAKRQMTWLRRNPYIVWGDKSAAEHYISTSLAGR